MKLCCTGNVFPFGPNQCYGGERILGYLYDQFANFGHDVYVFAPKGTSCSKHVKDLIEVPSMDSSNSDVYEDAVRMYMKQHHITFDVYQCSYFGERWKESALSIAPIYVELVWNRWAHVPWQLKQRGFNIVSYSKILQEHFRRVKVPTTCIYYRLPIDLYQFNEKPDDYVVWIGKIEGGKAPSLAIKTALRANKKIVIMGPPYNTGTFWAEVAPYIDNKKVFWVRGVDDYMKHKIMRNATAFISSNRAGWCEHAGIVGLEAYACGTPIIAFNNIDDPSAIAYDPLMIEGQHGFFVNYTTTEEDESIIEKAANALNSVKTIDRRVCRDYFEQNFTSIIQANKFIHLYEEILKHGNIESITF